MTSPGDPTIPIASRRYVVPFVREITPVAPASRALEASRRATAEKRRPRPGTTDLELVVTAAAAGDQAAMSELVERFTPRVRAAARSHGLRKHDVDEVTQATWLRLLKNVHTIRNPNGVGAWLETTARRESLRVLKANSREHLTDTAVLLDDAAPAEDKQPLPTPERCAPILAAALEQLPGHQRELLSMLFADPTPRYIEISRELGIPIGSIGPTRARSLARLRENQVLRKLAHEYSLDGG